MKPYSQDYAIGSYTCNGNKRRKIKVRKILKRNSRRSMRMQLKKDLFKDA